MNCLRPEAASEGSFIKISCAQEVSDSLAQMQFIWKRPSSLCLRGEKKKFYIFLMLFWILFVSFSLPRSPNCSLYMCASSSPPHQLCCILSGFPLPFVFSFSPTSGPTDPNVLVLISFPDWTHFLSWPYFSWPSPSFLYTCPELFSCQTPNRGAVLWKSLKKAKHWKIEKMVLLSAALFWTHTACVGASEDCTRSWVARTLKTFLSIKGQMQNFNKLV